MLQYRQPLAAHLAAITAGVPASTRYLSSFVAVAAIALVVAACNDDREPVDVTVVQPTATEAQTSVVDGGGPDDSNGGDADDSAQPSPPPEDPTPEDSATPPTGGAGTITIGEMVFQYDVTTCSVEEDGSAVASGPGQTADGQPFFAEAHLDPGGAPANASVNVGVDSAGAQGDPRWQGANVTDAVVSTEGGLSLSFTTSFVDLGALEPREMPGSVDVSCQ